MIEQSSKVVAKGHNLLRVKMVAEINPIWAKLELTPLKQRVHQRASQR